MPKFPYILSEYEEINSILYKPINSTQRIKYTCFNVSPSYIILGSTSGSIYLFSRTPCSFLQLIPLSEGAVSCVLISPDERIVALTTIRGVVCLVALKPSPKLIAISVEHINEQVNCLCWNDNSSEIYIGDWNGKISVMVLSIFTVNGMFQAPSCTLMTLDAAIVQLSFSSPLLLVSTLTRCYICDTVQEQYKQVGNKARNGVFGACFYKTCLTKNNSALVVQKDERLTNKKGSRLWEVSANGVVIKTHQFKEALAIAPVKICQSNIRESIYLKHLEQTWTPQSINFSHLFIIGEKYLFSYTSSGLYVIDPIAATIVLWNNEFSNIIMAESIENKIYLMTSNGEFHCLTLSSLDTLILLLYNGKKYQECLEICLVYKTELKKLIDGTEIDAICNIENKLQQIKDDELFTLLHSLTLHLESNSKVNQKKLHSGIVIVNSGNSGFKSDENFRHKAMSHSPMQCTENSSEIELTLETIPLTQASIDSKNESNETEDANCNISKEIVNFSSEETLEVKEGLDSIKSAMQKIQDDLRGVYSLFENIRLSMHEEELEKVIVDINWRMNVIKDSYETLSDVKSFVYEILRSAELYYFNVLLENTSTDLIQSTDNKRIINQIMVAFISINAQSCRRCTCSRPCLTNELTEPQFLEIGRSLLKKFVNEDKEQCVGLCNGVPYMWRDYLPIYVKQHNILTNDILCQCLQIKDSIILSIILPLLDEKQWNLTAMYIKKIHEGQCLFCGKSIKIGNDEIPIQWTTVINEITRKQGSDTAMEILVNLEKAIPNVPIDKSIFQSLVFTKILHKHGMKHAINFNKNTLKLSEYSTVCSTKVRDQLIEVLEKDLGRSMDKNVFGNGAHHWGMQYQNKFSTCPCCTLFLQTPILLGNNGIAIFGCGHAYHVNCMIEKKITTCSLHSSL
ncbi:WD40 repeat domain-containing protein pink isoform X2 [Calliopsis andreniformis]|uniref:WD40 repeat domain-containing protein pink isoform X2 n=1 Tax=Calliopsis andreniformis TaxID=337506 RepID=UPI003FCD19A6